MISLQWVQDIRYPQSEVWRIEDVRRTSMVESFSASGTTEQICEIRHLFDCAKAFFVALSKYNCDTHIVCKVENGEFKISGELTIFETQNNSLPRPDRWIGGALEALHETMICTDLTKGTFMLSIVQTVELNRLERRY